MVDKNKIRKLPEWESLFQNSDYQVLDISKTYKHQLTHQTINTRFFSIEIKNLPEPLNNDMLLVKKDELHRYPVSKLIENYLSTIDL